MARKRWEMMSFAEACEHHSMLKASDPGHSNPDADNMHGAIPAEELTAVWDTVTGRDYASTPLSDAVSITMPQEHVALLRSANGIPAAFLMLAIADVIVDKLDDDTGFDDITDFELRAEMDKVWERFEERRRLADNIEEGFGFDRSRAWQTVREVGDDQYRAQMVENIARLAGRMYRSMVGLKIKRRTDQPEEVKDITIGGDLTMLLASEHAQMGAGGSMGDMKTLDVLKEQAQQLRMMGEATCSRGPLVVLVDESGSMHDYGQGQGRNTWAKACLLALTRIAHEDKRMVACVHYGTATQIDRLAPGDHLAVYRAVCTFVGGGTDIATAFDVGITQVRRLKQEGQDGADIVLITDGEDPQSVPRYPHLIKSMKKQEARLWTVAIEANISPTNPIREEAAKYVHVHGTGLTADAAKGLEDAAFAEPRRAH